MIIYNRDFNYPTKYTLDKLVEVAKAVSTTRTLTTIKWINVGINVAAVLATLAIFKFNLIALAIAFVVTDMILLEFNRLVFITIPKRLSQTTDVDVVKKRIAKAEKEINCIRGQVFKFRRKECDYCRNSCYPDCYKCVPDLLSSKKRLEQFIENEKIWIEEETARLADQVKQQEIQETQPKNKAYSGKRDQIVEITDSFKHYRTDYQMDFLDPVLESLNTLIGTLDKKQIGYSLVNNSLCIYLDELQNIISKWADLDSMQKSRYEQDIAKISKALSENINGLIERIDRVETENIEVGIAVLLKELNEKTGGEENA